MLRGLYVCWILLSSTLWAASSYMSAEIAASRTDELKCPCPFSVFSREDGTEIRCGGMSAYCKSGGVEPVCYLPGSQNMTRLHCP